MFVFSIFICYYIFCSLEGRRVWSSEDTCRTCFSPAKLRSSVQIEGVCLVSPYFIIVSFVGKSWFLIINIISCFHLQWKVAPKALIVYNRKTAGCCLSRLEDVCDCTSNFSRPLNFTLYCLLMLYFIDLVFHLFQI